ncbi:MAG: YraN family protein [Patescibacteria group bacterium]
MKIVNPIAKLGEDKACEFLKKIGFKIIERNFRKGYGEIDIVAIDPSTGSTSPSTMSSGSNGSLQASSGQALVFIEVKTRTSGQFGTPLEAITYWKLKSIIKTAQFYKMVHPRLPDSLRIDAISVVLHEGGTEKIEHIKNISGF